MRRVRGLLLATPLPALLLFAALATAGGTAAAVKSTDTPSFCTSCHEMTPYYDAWSAGAHKDVSCVACHVDPGAVAQATHKVSALKEVYAHYAGAPKFPQGTADVPDRRCLACHEDLPKVTKNGFAHARHAKEAPCATCHDDAGHKVSREALERAGIAASVPSSVSVESTSGAHVPVGCSRCHAPAATACEKCHRSRHAARGTCLTCHSAGKTWAFAHPGADAPCATCHEAPKRHYAGTCASCHEAKTPFARTAFAHTDAACASCHRQPYGHRVTATAACGDCHPRKGESWTFAHPGSKSCADCHSAPAKHYRGACADCHEPKTPFARTRFSHPASGACETCHDRPAGHRRGSCASCHTQRGKSWAFSHPSSKSCASCHSAPAKHFSGSCSDCHAPGTPFSKARFSHPASGGCADCHDRPSGHRSGDCTSCHTQRGRSWAFSHPSSKSCASCHSAPGGHYGTSCADCHAPSRAWRTATFTHPRVNGEHTYRSFTCSKCHPSSPPKVGCTCHGGGRNGPEDD